MSVRTRSLAILLVSLVASAGLSGCISAQAVSDWWDDVGTVIVKIGTLPLDAPGQHVNELSTVKLALVSTRLYPVNEISAIAGVTYARPLGVDLKKRFDDDEFMRVFETKVATKTIERIGFQFFIVEVKDHAGERVPACPQKDREEAEHPCIAIPPGGNYEFDLSPRPTALKRGGVTEFHFPLTVNYDEKLDEYYIQGRSHESEAPVIVR